MRKNLYSFLFAVIIFALALPMSVSANTDDISQIIREAQAQAVQEAGSLSEVTPEYVLERSKEIIAQEYGIDLDTDIDTVAKDLEESVSSYDSGYIDGYSNGYEAGIAEGMRKAEHRTSAEKEEMKNNRLGAYFSIFVVIMISAVVAIMDKIKYRKNRGYDEKD